MEAQTVLLKGYLHKRGFHNKGWRKRWFVLSDHGLYYYGDKSEKDVSVLLLFLLFLC